MMNVDLSVGPEMTKLQKLLDNKTRPFILDCAEQCEVNPVTVYRWKNGQAFPRYQKSIDALIRIFANEGLDHNGIFAKDSTDIGVSP